MYSYTLCAIAIVSGRFASPPTLEIRALPRVSAGMVVSPSPQKGWLNSVSVGTPVHTGGQRYLSQIVQLSISVCGCQAGSVISRSISTIKNTSEKMDARQWARASGSRGGCCTRSSWRIRLGGGGRVVDCQWRHSNADEAIFLLMMSYCF